MLPEMPVRAHEPLVAEMPNVDTFWYGVFRDMVEFVVNEETIERYSKYMEVGKVDSWVKFIDTFLRPNMKEEFKKGLAWVVLIAIEVLEPEWSVELGAKMMAWADQMGSIFWRIQG